MRAEEQERPSDHELSLAELLADPLVLALMHADCVQTREIVSLFLEAKAQRTASSAGWHFEQRAVVRPGDRPIPHVRTVQGSAAAPADYAGLRKAITVLRAAKQKLREAERRFDCDRGSDPAVLIQQVRGAERDLHAARADVARLGRSGPS
jgi:hypothetical protein